MKNLLIIAIILNLASCKQEVYNNDGMNIARSAPFSVENKQGIDLLNPNLPESYKENDIWLYYDINGKVEKVLLPAPPVGQSTNFDTKGFGIDLYAYQSRYTLLLYLNIDGLDRNMTKYTTTYILWPNQDLDTIKTLFHHVEGSIAYSELWYNGVELRQNAILEFRNDTSKTKLFHFRIIR